VKGEIEDRMIEVGRQFINEAVQTVRELVKQEEEV
jgi:hypothetical protein